jgi:hypothetical protein
MTELPYVDSFDPEEKDGLALPSTSENSVTTFTLTPPGTQYGATLCKLEQRKPLGYAVSARLCKPLEHPYYHS